MKNASHWDEVARGWRRERPQRLWRAYSDRMHARLLERWLPEATLGRVLKTDVFDEFAGTGLGPLLASRARLVVGIDLSEPILGDVPAESGLCRAAADVRRLPFPDAVFDRVISNSTLDHFERLDDLATALRELARVLRPGGELLLTLDNTANPVVALRNALPAALLMRARLIPYRMGASCGPRRLTRLVEGAGLVSVERSALLHCPRLPAVVLARLLESRDSARLRSALFAAFSAWDVLERLPTRFLTGYFLALRARRPA